MGKIKIKITKISSVVLQKAIGFLRFLEWVFFEVSGFGFLRILDVATIHVLLLVLIFLAVLL